MIARLRTPSRIDELKNERKSLTSDFPAISLDQ